MSEVKFKQIAYGQSQQGERLIALSEDGEIYLIDFTYETVNQAKGAYTERRGSKAIKLNPFSDEPHIINERDYGSDIPF